MAYGHDVTGSTTHTQKLKVLEEASIHPFLIRYGKDGFEGDVSGFFTGKDVLIINIPPGGRKDDTVDYVGMMRAVLTWVLKSGIVKVVFVSSISVYGESQGEVDETTIPEPATENGRRLWECERMFQECESIRVAVIRFGGLIGAGRHPVHYLAGKKNISNGDEIVQLIHLDDCIGIIYKVVSENVYPLVYNGVYPSEVLKRDYYPKEAQKRGLISPHYAEGTGVPSGKRMVPWQANYLNYRYKRSVFLG